MVEAIRIWFVGREAGPVVRPWGLAAPILVLVCCLPLLRPLRQPTGMSENEAARFATIQAIVEHQTLAINDGSFALSKNQIAYAPDAARSRYPNEAKLYSKQPPVLATLMSGSYWVMFRSGLSFQSNMALATYLLTLIGATIPVALAAAMVYRMGRLFELKRPWRMTLAIASVFGSGLVSYATALNAHAPAAALILGACVCFFHAGVAKHRSQSQGWLVGAGFCAALASVIDVGTVVFLFLLVCVILAMRWPPASKLGGVLLYALGALPPLVLHAALTVPMTGDVRPGFLHPELLADAAAATSVAVDDDEEDEQEARPSWVATSLMHFADGVLGPHGLLSHFPVLLIGLGGIGVVLHRHWPAATKTLAVATFVGGLGVIFGYACLGADWGQPMFAVRWFIPFLPLVVFWAGAWLRKQHHPAMWAGAAALLGFSILTTLLGATAPFVDPRDGEHTAFAAARHLLAPPQPDTADQIAAAAGR